MFMKMLISLDELKLKKAFDWIPLKCEICSKDFVRSKSMVLRILKGKSVGEKAGSFCSVKCCGRSRNTQIVVNCKQCNELFHKPKGNVNRVFCSRTCSGIYNNKHKTHGFRRSKLECWMEQKLKEKYTDLEFIFNKRELIGYELDLYIPILNIAFEFNGIVHYKPIYGEQKFNSIKINDLKKSEICKTYGIELKIIDVSKMKSFRDSRGKEFLDEVVSTIEMRKTISKTGAEPRI